MPRLTLLVISFSLLENEKNMSPLLRYIELVFSVKTTFKKDMNLRAANIVTCTNCTEGQGWWGRMVTDVK